MWKAWLINLKKTKISLLWLVGLVAVFLTTTGFIQDNIEDNLHLLNKETKTLITEKNNRYFQTKEQPQITVITVKRLNKLTPKALDHSKRSVFIVVGQKGKKRNVQIFSTKDLHGAFTADTRANILRAEVNKLRSNNKNTFNEGLRFVFRACATRVDQQYQYALDKYDLTSAEQNKISHPHSVALPIALALAFLIMGIVYVLNKFGHRNISSPK
ncbi:TPM domain-containing protein [Lactobacillus kefiranofaciens]|uniref:TPM domain-containing protein n=1 Tax=Lactobacillus kefiranofaciens TaxID=267818 RepID=UPI00191C47E7|nr:TPM domain-containing protein [Lactobacillus kefiranofaciens]MCP9331289.1 TPM domain-containing protein [Lactobacillus kefiranofaciens]